MSERELLLEAAQELGRVVRGQDRAVRDLLVGFFAGGHVLLEGVPGVAKTLLARSLAHVFDLRYRRIQFTPDLMPSDVLGTSVFDPAAKSFSFRHGPVFTDILLADEINRTPPKTQAALLEAMEERQVTVDGQSYELPDTFFVIATQNPVEYEGTYPLPEAQQDRFLLQVRVGYPGEEDEVGILRLHSEGFDPRRLAEAGLRKLFGPAEIARVRAAIRAVRVEEPVLRYAAAIARRSRTSPTLLLGASPRAGIALVLAARVLAAMRGAEFATPEEVKEMAPPVLRHRVLLRPESEIEGMTADDAVAQVLGAVEVPR